MQQQPPSDAAGAAARDAVTASAVHAASLLAPLLPDDLARCAQVSRAWRAAASHAARRYVAARFPAAAAALASLSPSLPPAAWLAAARNLAPRTRARTDADNAAALEDLWLLLEATHAPSGDCVYAVVIPLRAHQQLQTALLVARTARPRAELYAASEDASVRLPPGAAAEGMLPSDDAAPRVGVGRDVRDVQLNVWLLRASTAEVAPLFRGVRPMEHLVHFADWSDNEDEVELWTGLDHGLGLGFMCHADDAAPHGPLAVPACFVNAAHPDTVAWLFLYASLKIVPRPDMSAAADGDACFLGFSGLELVGAPVRSDGYGKTAPTVQDVLCCAAGLDWEALLPPASAAAPLTSLRGDSAAAGRYALLRLTRVSLHTGTDAETEADAERVCRVRWGAHALALAELLAANSPAVTSVTHPYAALLARMASAEAETDAARHERLHGNSDEAPPVYVLLQLHEAEKKEEEDDDDNNDDDDDDDARSTPCFAGAAPLRRCAHGACTMLHIRAAAAPLPASTRTPLLLCNAERHKMKLMCADEDGAWVERALSALPPPLLASLWLLRAPPGGAVQLARLARNLFPAPEPPDDGAVSGATAPCGVGVAPNADDPLAGLCAQAAARVPAFVPLSARERASITMRFDVPYEEAFARANEDEAGEDDADDLSLAPCYLTASASFLLSTAAAALRDADASALRRAGWDAYRLAGFCEGGLGIQQLVMAPPAGEDAWPPQEEGAYMVASVACVRAAMARMDWTTLVPPPLQPRRSSV